ncbi:hypothetical protein Lal_00024190 [Lupinus albus]|nr:hypothetical protein Lal_00024190 [Lupinus albus]
MEITNLEDSHRKNEAEKQAVTEAHFGALSSCFFFTPTVLMRAFEAPTHETPSRVGVGATCIRHGYTPIHHGYVSVEYPKIK